MCVGMRVNRDLIGNILVYLSTQCPNMYQTKMLKLLFLIDEESVKRSGAPITWLQYNTWQYGPVSEDVYYSKNDGENKFSEFVDFTEVEPNKFLVTPIAEFDDSLLSDFDMEVIDSVIKKYGKKSAGELVEITHIGGTLWDITRKKHGIVFSDSNKTSDVPIDFTEHIKDDAFKKMIYYSTLESVEMQA
jgi:uncharacterized phage-associated protein